MTTLLSASHASSAPANAPTFTEESPVYHLPVLLAETVAALAPGPGKLFVDGTLGGGGHTAALLEAGASVIGLDQDPEALAHCIERLGTAGGRFAPVHSSFVHVARVLQSRGIAEIDGMLLDLGVSSHQIDTPGRGFSFQQDGPLDMRMDTTSGVTAATIVNTWEAEELMRIFWELGEEPAARKIVQRLVRDREKQEFTTTLQLAAAVEAVVPRRGRIHPATRVFQAIRMAVNGELDVLEPALAQITSLLKPGGRVAVITFHSLEDRVVKHFLKQRATEWLDRPEWPEPRRNPEYAYRLLGNRPHVASAVEQAGNPRSRSAKLRAAEKLPARSERLLKP